MVYIIYFFVLNVFFSIDVESKGREMFSLKQKLIILSLSLLIIFVVSTNMYIVWSHVGADLIDGIQGRYFASVLLPAAAFFSIMLPARKSCFFDSGFNYFVSYYFAFRYCLSSVFKFFCLIFFKIM